MPKKTTATTEIDLQTLKRNKVLNVGAEENGSQENMNSKPRPSALPKNALSEAMKPSKLEPSRQAAPPIASDRLWKIVSLVLFLLLLLMLILFVVSTLTMAASELPNDAGSLSSPSEWKRHVSELKEVFAMILDFAKDLTIQAAGLALLIITIVTLIRRECGKILDE